ncbi:MAG: DNA lesion error-prone repair protein ImuA [Dokdonella sp.]
MAAVLTEGSLFSLPPSLRRAFVPTRPAPTGLFNRNGGFSALRSSPTGYAALDAELPNGGWTRGALTELLTRHPMTTLPVVLPALQRLARMHRRIAVIVPSSVPYVKALVAAGIDSRLIVELDGDGVDIQWTTEQCLRDGGFSAVVSWLVRADYAQLRRLHQAADSSDALAFALRPAVAIDEFGTPAALRATVNADANGTQVEIIKCRGRIGARFAPISLG